MYRGCFINLDRNERRRARLSANLVRAELVGRYERIPATDGAAVGAQYRTKLDPGSLGLWLTHQRIVAEFASADRHLHVLEDDAVLPANASLLFDQALAHADASLSGWDLLFTETMVPFELFRVYADLMKLHAKENRFSYFDLAPYYMACMSSFFINRDSIEKYGRLIKDQWRLGIPIDMHVRRLVREKQLRACVTVPFMTSISPESDQSDIRGELDRSHRVYDVFRRGFYVEADMPALLKEMKQLTRDTTIGPLEGLYLNGLAFYMSDKWVRF